MKTIDKQTLENELRSLGATGGYIDFVLNNVSQYNDLVEAYEASVDKIKRKENYLMYQLNVQITKQILALYPKTDKKQETDDPLTDLIKGLKPDKVKPPRDRKGTTV